MVGKNCKVTWAAIIIAFTTAACQQKAAEAPAPKPAAVDPVKRGEYLVTIIGCNDCHTPFKMGPHGPEHDMSRLLSGHPESVKLPPPPKLAPDAPWNWTGAAVGTAFGGPWGITYATNLTPDQNTGIGIWTEQMFIDSIRNGRHMGGQGRPIQPPMPWPWFAKMTDDDLKAMYAYLRSIPPIQNRVPEYQEPQGR
jgi:hypothetical protein